MSGPNPHTAAGQALGYVHQAQWGLIELIQRARKSPTTLLRLETLDDIETSVPETDAVELTQVKHQVTPATDLSENSVDLWRSLNVWMDVLASGVIAGTPVLKLVTTASIPADSALNYLRADESARNIGLAVAGLEDAARQGRNATTQAWRQKFLDLDASARSSFLSLITIDDNSPRARDVGQTLREALRFATPHGHDDTFIQYLLGWWYQICVRLLDRTLDAVSAGDPGSDNL